MPAHLEWKTVLMTAIANVAMTITFYFVIMYMPAKELTGQDVCNMTGSVALAYFGVNMICFGAKWAMDFFTSKLPKTQTDNPKKED
jgi:hypothetical protein